MMKPFDPLDKIDYVQDTIVSEVLFSDGENSVNLLAMDSGTELNTHTSPSTACVYVLEGDVEFVIENEKFNLSTGEMIIIEKNAPHSVSALSSVKLILTKI